MDAALCACTIDGDKWNRSSVPQAAGIRPPALGMVLAAILVPRVSIKILRLFRRFCPCNLCPNATQVERLRAGLKAGKRSSLEGGLPTFGFGATLLT